MRSQSPTRPNPPRPAPPARPASPIGLALVAAALLAALPWPAGATPVRAPVRQASQVTLQAVDSRAIADALVRAPAPRLGGDERARAGTAGAPESGAPAAPQVADQRHVIDAFERAGWPAAAGSPGLGWAYWLPQTLADLRRSPGGYVWATSTCHAAAGDRGLCAVCGGEGTALACDAAYPPDTAPSILLFLDLSKKQNMDRLDLVMDIWADTPPDEGVLLNYVTYDRAGEVVERRTIHSATGRLRDWARNQRINLLSVRDQMMPGWQASLAGRLVYLEFLFLSHAGTGKGEGLHIDNLALESRPATIPVTPMPYPTPSSPSHAYYCAKGMSCGTVQVEGYVDYRCDGRYQAGVDRRLSGQWVDVVAGIVPLRARLSPSGSAYFILPIDADVIIRVEIPPGQKMCVNSANPLTLHPSDFSRSTRKKVSVRMLPGR